MLPGLRMPVGAAMTEQKPPLFLPDYILEDYSILPNAPMGFLWVRDDNRCGYILKMNESKNS